MSQKSYNAEEIEQKLINEINKDTTLNNMMNDTSPPSSGNSTKKTSSLYMDEVELGGEYAPTAAPSPTVGILDLEARAGGGSGIDDRESNKHGRFYRNTIGPIVVFCLAVVFVASILAIVITSISKQNTHVDHPSWIDDVETSQTQLAMPHANDVVPSSVPEHVTTKDKGYKNEYEQEQGGGDGIIVLVDEEDEDYPDDYEDEQDENDFKDVPVDFNEETDYYEDEDEPDDYDDEEMFEFEDEMVCIPKIHKHQELLPESTPVIASDGETIVAMHGKRLNFYAPDQSQTYTYLALPETHARSVNSNELSEDITLALDGSNSIMGDYMRYDETGVVYVLKSRGEGKREATAVIVPPDDVEDGGMFGFSIDIYGDRLIIGAPFGNGDEAGSAYVYAQNAEGVWELEEIFPPEDEDGTQDLFQLFGESVAIHKNRVAVSGYNEFDEVTVFVYEYSDLSDSWEEIDDIIVDKHCQECKGAGVAVSFRDDGGLFLSYPRHKTVTYLVPTDIENGGEYALVQKIHVSEGGDLDMDQVEVGGTIMVVGVTDHFDESSLVFVYSQSDDDDQWVKVNEIELPPNEDFDPEVDYIDLALSKSNLIVNYGDEKLLLYNVEGCE